MPDPSAERSILDAALFEGDPIKPKIALFDHVNPQSAALRHTDRRTMERPSVTVRSVDARDQATSGQCSCSADAVLFAEGYGYPVARRSWQETPVLAADLFCGDRSILVSAMTNINVTRERRSLLWSPSSATREICSELAIVVGMEGSHHPVPPGEMCRIVATEELMMLIVMRHADEW
jgi:hypothetical protein